jgi:hypothetical protein
MLGRTEQSNDSSRGFLALLGKSEQMLGETEQSKLRGAGTWDVGVNASGKARFTRYR